eukprot:m.366489 g.366489  ORF g.366489 m.366489 type:complete len:304 (-) comp36286_c0_seq1:106-1017(-)
MIHEQNTTMQSPIYLDAALDTERPGYIRKVYSGEVSDKYKWKFLCSPGGCMSMSSCISFCKWPMLKRRMYFEVHENRIEINYPYLSSSCSVRDNVYVKYFSSKQSLVKPSCSSELFCSCFPLFGEAVRLETNCCFTLCCGCNTDFGGFKDAAEFVRQANEARRVYLQRMKAGTYVVTTTVTTQPMPGQWQPQPLLDQPVHSSQGQDGMEITTMANPMFQHPSSPAITPPTMSPQQPPLTTPPQEPTPASPPTVIDLMPQQPMSRAGMDLPPPASMMTPGTGTPAVVETLQQQHITVAWEESTA